MAQAGSSASTENSHIGLLSTGLPVPPTVPNTYESTDRVGVGGASSLGQLSGSANQASVSTCHLL